MYFQFIGSMKKNKWQGTNEPLYLYHLLYIAFGIKFIHVFIYQQDCSYYKQKENVKGCLHYKSSSFLQCQSMCCTLIHDEKFKIISTFFLFFICHFHPQSRDLFAKVFLIKKTSPLYIYLYLTSSIHDRLTKDILCFNFCYCEITFSVFNVCGKSECCCFFGT